MTRHSQDFHPALRVLHGLMALAVLAMLFIGVGMVSTAGPLYPTLLALHRPIGIMILVLVLIRLPLRLATGAPVLPDDIALWQKRIAGRSHILLYAAMIGMPLIGWAMLSAGGYPVVVTKGFTLPPILPHDLALYALLREAHTVVALLFFALILGHLAAALVHGLVRRDGVLRSMTIGCSAAQPIAEGSAETASSEGAFGPAIVSVDEHSGIGGDA
ncbi:MAG: cytochrome B [Novosphingobium sp. 17-62-19]|uniref:cytochrome b n=1 Tax=Novosphingobium sp. 17-62-19 TaxID=1970406 RepID=UPI000BD2B7E5|nr:cytochrome b [Novosphingobium sp. 17-62-19]OZA16865.1 MAG: cytochrome B [Novosphingobium sp. 17-62-19]HQS97696.1 cytochrome b [Novosphingobium sp.]